MIWVVAEVPVTKYPDVRVVVPWRWQQFDEIFYELSYPYAEGLHEAMPRLDNF